MEGMGTKMQGNEFELAWHGQSILVLTVSRSLSLPGHSHSQKIKEDAITGTWYSGLELGRRGIWNPKLQVLQHGFSPLFAVPALRSLSNSLEAGRENSRESSSGWQRPKDCDQLPLFFTVQGESFECESACNKMLDHLQGV